jgi:subtilisin family serine protease
MGRTIGVVSALLLVMAMGAPAAGAATTCTYPPSAYSSAGSPGGPPADDPLFPRQWGLTQIKAPAAWARGARGANTTIAVIDTGADLAHPDLQANLVPGVDFVPPEEPDAGVCPGPQDENGHGTHTAGIAAAVTNNGIGVAGTAPDAKVMPLRALDAEGSGQDAWIIAAIRHAADNGAEVINLSLGGAPVIGQAPQLNEDLEKAAAYAWDKGSVIVGSAGNESFPLCSYPAAARYALCVGATDRRGAPSAYSNFPNDPDTTVGVRAPGGAGSPFCEDDEDIWSTIWPGSSSDCGGSGSLVGYDTVAGTSMAAPYASGVAALLSGRGLTNAQIMECFKRTSSKKGAYDPVYGYGIADADAATATCTPQATAAYTPTPTPAGGGSTGGGQTGGSSGTPGAGGESGGGQNPGGGNAEGRTLTVTILRASRTAVARRGLVRVRITSNGPISGRLVALASRGGKGGKAIGRARFSLTRAGTRVVRVKLSPAGRRALVRSSKTQLRVRYVAGGLRGYATTKR